MKKVEFYMHFAGTLMWILLSACGSDIEKNGVVDSNDTNAVFSVNDKPPAKLPAKPTLEQGKRKCVTPSMPAEVTFSYKYTTNDGSNVEFYVEINRVKQFETKKQRTYIESMRILRNLDTDADIKSYFDRNEISEFFTITEDGLFEDMTKDTRYGLIRTKLSEHKRKGWWKVTHYTSGETVIKDSRGHTETYRHGKGTIHTYLPYRRRFRKFCEGEMFHKKWTTITKTADSKRAIAEEDDMRCSVMAVDEPFWLPSGNFNTIRLECVSNGKHYVDRIDSKTGVWLYHKGEDTGEMRVTSYSAIR